MLSAFCKAVENLLVYKAVDIEQAFVFVRRRRCNIYFKSFDLILR